MTFALKPYQKESFWELKTTKFKLTEESDYDRKVAERVFSGRMTKMRYKIIDGFCRRHSKQIPNCGHEWDCCGCLCGQYMEFEYKQNQVTITLVQNFNY